jgi:ABC-type transport system involved in multi-copper enzyme maturation permease subunit
VSRTTVLSGKLFAAFLTLLATYCFLMIYMTVGSSIVYGPQNNLQYVPLSLLGALFSTLIWIALVLFLGTLFRSSLIAALGTLGIFLGTTIIGGILSVFGGQGWILNYIPGAGNTGYVNGPPASAISTAVSAGTDNIGPNLINYLLHPSWGEVTFYKILTLSPTASQITWTPLYSEPLSTIILTSITVALVYFILFVAISWHVFRRAQITE